MNRTLARLLIFAVASLGTTGLVEAQSRNDGRLFYEMAVTNAGSRSQGLEGTLYDAAGNAVTVAPGETVETDIGTFIMNACAVPWDSCGMYRKNDKEDEAVDIFLTMDSVPWEFRLYVIAEGSRSEGWRGELWHGDQQVMPEGTKPLATALGHFLPRGDAQMLWDWSGWIPASWAAE